MAIRLGLVREVVVMAIDTVRGNKMRSARGAPRSCSSS